MATSFDYLLWLLAMAVLTMAVLLRLYAAPQLPYGRIGFTRFHVDGDLNGDFNGALNGDLNGDINGDLNGDTRRGNVSGAADDLSGDLSGDVSGGVSGGLLTQLRHEGESGGAFAAVVLGGADPNT